MSDEWAADQDPLFKEIFYRRPLPELKARGKSVLVINDDRYFDLADHVLRLNDGRLEQDTQSPAVSPVPVTTS